MYYLIQQACHTISLNEKHLYPSKKIRIGVGHDDTKAVDPVLHEN